MPSVVSTFEFVQPVGGKRITWAPLKTSAELQVLAAYRQEQNRHLQNYARLAARITHVDGQAVTFQPNDFGPWDNFDTESFLDEVTIREAERAAALSKKSPEDAAGVLDAAAEEAMAVIAKLAGAIQLVRQLAHTARPQ